jgi:hypothetical protein
MMRVREFYIFVFILLLSSCTSEVINSDSNSKRIILLDAGLKNIRNTSEDVNSDSIFSYRIDGYGHPNVYVDLIHSPLDIISEINFSNLKKHKLIDSDTLGFNDWFAIDNNEEIYIIFMEDYEELISEEIKNKKIRLYKIYVIARSIE